ncbi:blue copper protein 1a-like [Curcuma longa]|uniref:blue copper protein 1a-like n=1 Tax=Curcuma longa TaxID=136217 RepID=UPI003D9ECC87
MASKLQALAVLLAIATVVLPVAMAADIMVGDDSGWRLDFNYTTWAENNMFMLGDNLVFNYDRGSHSVVAVGGDDFRTCNVSNGAIKTFDSGNDVIPLNTTGKRWYVCGVGDHCSRGQKLAVEVLPAMATPPSSSNRVMSQGYQTLMAVVIAAMMMMMMS